MTEELLLRLCDTQAQFFGDLIEPWKKDHEAGEIAGMMEDLLPKFTKIVDDIQELDQGYWDAAFRGEVKKIQALGESMVSLYHHLLQGSEDIRPLCLEAIEAGYPIAAFSAFELALDRLYGLKGRWIEQWPWIDHEMLEQTAREYENGKYQSAREAINELRHRSS